MRDSFNSMLMTMGAGRQLSNANSTAATFASVATDLTQTATSSKNFESATINNSELSAEQITFNDVLNGELKSFLAQQTAGPAKQQTFSNITQQELTKVAQALNSQMLENKPQLDIEVTSSGDLDTEPSRQRVLLDDSEHAAKGPIQAEPADTKSTLKQVTGLLMKLAAIESNDQTIELPSIGGVSDDEISKLNNADNRLADSGISLADIDNDALASAESSVQYITDTTSVELQQSIATTGLTSESAVGQSSTSRQNAGDLVSKLEKLIEPLANNDQLQSQLAAIKQSLSQPLKDSEQITQQPIEQVIEQRINQPIDELIRQPTDKSYDIKVETNKTENKVDDATKQIEALISKLPPSSQQQLVAMMKTSEQQELARLTPSADPSNKFAMTAQDTIAGQVRIEGQDSKAVADRSLSNIPATAMVIEPANSDKKTLADNINIEKANVDKINADKLSADKINNDKIHADKISAHNTIADIVDAENLLSNGKEADSRVKSNTTDSFDNLLRQMEMTSGRSRSGNVGIRAESEIITPQLSGADKIQDSALAAKESLNQTTKTDQLNSKLPLAQDTAAAKMLKERVSMMVTGNIQQAVIQLDPEELGGMNIRLQIQNDQMSVQFQVQNSQAKEMLENAMVKLREMLDQQGIVLKDSDVQQHDQREQQEMSEPPRQQGSSDEEFVSDQEALVLTLHKQSSDGIDYYA